MQQSGQPSGANRNLLNEICVLGSLPRSRSQIYYIASISPNDYLTDLYVPSGPEALRALVASLIALESGKPQAGDQ
jgi:hypothetical protein